MGFFDAFKDPDYSKYNKMAGEIRGAYGDFEKRQQGVGLGVTAADQEMAQKSIGYTGDLARLQLEQILPGILSQVSGQAGARGLGGSQIEGIQRSMAGNEQARLVQQMLLDEQRQTAQALPQMAFQRAGMELGRNAQLFQSLIGSYEPGFQLEGMKIQQQQQRQASARGAIGGAIGMAGRIGVGIATGGASEVARAAGGAYSGPSNPYDASYYYGGR